MDELKLNKWKENFEKGAKELQIEFDSFFKENNLDKHYHLTVDSTTQNLCLTITDENLPREIKSGLEKLFMISKPEDSI